ncbi:hypothetical protein RQP46_008004 [Phenoliferia psychrophenolica]
MSDYYSTTPQIPLEITHQILKNATLDLVEQERRDYTLVGQTNAFLLSASLVSRTWRNIAQPLLLKYGLVDPIGITRFLRELKRTGVLDSLDVIRIGVTDRSRRQFRHTFGKEVDKSEAELNTEAINKLLKMVESLRGLEFNGPNLLVDGPSWQSSSYVQEILLDPISG